MLFYRMGQGKPFLYSVVSPGSAVIDGGILEVVECHFVLHRVLSELQDGLDLGVPLQLIPAQLDGLAPHLHF